MAPGWHSGDRLSLLEAGIVRWFQYPGELCPEPLSVTSADWFLYLSNRNPTPKADMLGKKKSAMAGNFLISRAF
jgi:hypothetical protein